MVKMRVVGGEYKILDNGKLICFKDAYDAWQYIFILREIREKVVIGQRSLYPVRSLNPIPERRGKERHIILEGVDANG